MMVDDIQPVEDEVMSQPMDDDVKVKKLNFLFL
jgi:hypothetical protein